MISWPPYPISVYTEKGEGWILYVKSNFQFANDEFCIILKSGGELLHMTSRQFRITSNATYGITKTEK